MSLDTYTAPSVAIIGTEGAGKTVLTAVLAKRLGDPEKGIFLNAQGPRTLKHVEKVWSILQNGDWPEGNPAGELFELRWKLEIAGHYVCDVRFIESAGQDIRVLFEGEQFFNATTPELKSLVNYCSQSDIVIFLVNLADFIGRKDPEAKASNEAAIKAAMDTLSQSGSVPRFCIVITQADLFQEEVVRLGSWNDVLKVHLGNLHGAYVHGGKVRVFPVSAVSETVVRDDGDGRMVRVPKAGFRSEGFEDLISWLSASTQVVAKELSEMVVVPAPQPFPVPILSAPSRQFKTGKSRLASTLSPLVALVACLVVLPKTCTNTTQIKGPDNRTIWEMMRGAAIPTMDVVAVNWGTVIIVTLIVCVIVLFVARAIEDENS